MSTKIEMPRVERENRQSTKFKIEQFKNEDKKKEQYERLITRKLLQAKQITDMQYLETVWKLNDEMK